MTIDDIVDHIENVVHSLSLYSVSKKHACIEQFADLFIVLTKDLEQLIEVFFQKHHNVDKLNKIIISIHKEEGEGDIIYMNTIRELFKTEKKPIELIKWKEIVEKLEEASDKYKDVTDVVANALMKNG
jgi:uncharacterized protein Yka (UPF0111/DUF47 family)